MLLQGHDGTVAETKKAMQKMRREGMSLQEIADKTGYSKARVGQLVAVHNAKGFTRHSTKGCIYTGLRHWLNENSICQWELVEMLGFVYSGKTASRIRDCMSGKRELKKSDIDALIRISGMNYEELFGEVG